MTTITPSPFGSGPSGQTIQLFTLRGANNCEVSITNYGGRIVSILAPDRFGTLGDIAIGFEKLDGYLAKNPYFGATVGRYANRIGNAQFTLDGTTYHLERNAGENSLHGGLHGFDKVVWEPSVITGAHGDALLLKHVSPDGHAGYPGTLSVQVTFSLTDTNELHILFEAITDKKTVVNLTNHSYFDLSAKQGQDGILNHVISINASRFTPVNEHLIPTGELAEVAGTPFDFRSPHPIGERIEDKNEQLKLAIGYDHNFVLDGEPGTVRLAARAVDPGSGRVLEVLTTLPGVQFYTGNHLDGTVSGKGGAVYRFRTAFCLETQSFPDSPNHPEFPSTVLAADQAFRSETVFRFGVEN
jgi:aldose 1-epimerase